MTVDAVGYLDQRALPQTVVRERARSVDDVVEAIRSLAVRGAPAIGIFGAYGVALRRNCTAVPRSTPRWRAFAARARPR